MNEQQRPVNILQIRNNYKSRQQRVSIIKERITIGSGQGGKRGTN